MKAAGASGGFGKADGVEDQGLTVAGAAGAEDQGLKTADPAGGLRSVRFCKPRSRPAAGRKARSKGRGSIAL